MKGALNLIASLEMGEAAEAVGVMRAGEVQQAPQARRKKSEKYR